MTCLTAGGAIERDGVVARLLPQPSLRMRIRPVADGRPVSGRVHLRAADGRELQPVDRARRVPDLGNVDQGTDVVRRGWRYAYVEGEFEVDAPPGDVYVEFAKGPAHEVARRIETAAHGAMVKLPIRRIADPRADGWLASDTHVHFLDPMAAHRQARAEGLELVHVMSAQWGDIVTNVMDLARGPVVSSDDAVVWVGTENRHHILGHYPRRGDAERAAAVVGRSQHEHDRRPDTDDRRRLGGRHAGGRRARDLPALPVPGPRIGRRTCCAAAWTRSRCCSIRCWTGGVSASGTATWTSACVSRSSRAPTRWARSGSSARSGHTRTRARRPSTSTPGQRPSAPVDTVVSVGALLDFRIDGLLPGGTIGSGATHHCTWKTASAYPLEALEIIANGAVVHRVALGRAGTFEGSLDLELPERGWVAARCAGPVISELGGPGGIFEGLQIGAHTSPHYRTDPMPADPAELRHLRTRVEGGLEWGRRLAKWASPDAQARFEQLMTDALGVLDRMQAPGD